MKARFLSPEPVVELVKRFDGAYENFLAAARTCYSSKGIVSEQDIGDRWDFLAQSLYRAGHHTTLQHAHYQFALDRVSRHFLWSFLHSHPFYNSEQASQRYVEVKSGCAAIPPLSGQALSLYEETIAFQMDRYRSLTARLMPLAEEQYVRRFPKRPLDKARFRGDVKKKAQEIARYVLPVATFSYLYHTISAVTLMRYWRLCQQQDAPLEQRIVAEKMIQALLKAEPKFEAILEEPLEPETLPEWDCLRNGAGAGFAAQFIAEFDASLEGRVSKLVDCKPKNEALLADSVREVLGRPRQTMSDEEAIGVALDPERNRLLGESLNLTTMAKLTRCLFHPSYTFRKKISHTADSQDQRHRMTPASRPILAAHLTGDPDFITPELIKMDDGVLYEYAETMERTWDAIRQLQRWGVEDEFVQYLLPNAAAVRFTESADLLNLRHKLAMRLCYNAQEEIWRASLDEARQICQTNPLIGKYLLPPCSLRLLSNQKPICPEGERFCGEKVWTYELDDYDRII
ncbi:MAG: FAD-dependent thymidylate synthase [Candidatus Omnitrophota bacterium]